MGLIKDKEYLLQDIRTMGIKDERVLKAIEETKRELFITKNIEKDAYGNYPLPIGYGQTISQPYTVAFMIELLDIRPGNTILEIGCGSGYNAAVMSLLVEKKGKIYSVEIIKELCNFAEKNFKKAGIKNVSVANADGYFGYNKAAPYDRIIITAGCPHIPKELLNQLCKNGILVMPLTKYFGETMIKVVKDKELNISEFGSFAFVPLRGAVEGHKDLNI